MEGSRDVGLSGPSAFATTHWSVVSAAGNPESPDAREALEKLCLAYWYPLYCYVRRRGVMPADAQDITQEFFCRMIDKKGLESVDRNRGSFRSFLLASINHLLANEWDKARALKRGGGRQILSLDAEEAEGRFIREPATGDSPEKSFDRRWALALLARALGILRAEFTEDGRLEQFEVLKEYLSDVAGEGQYGAVASQLGIDASGVAMAVHRLRKRYREIVRAELAETVSTESELKAEMRHLFASLD